jgi:hypothetical protein
LLNSKKLSLAISLPSTVNKVEEKWKKNVKMLFDTQRPEVAERIFDKIVVTIYGCKVQVCGE